MWIVRLALRRPYTFAVMALLILVLGGAAIRQSRTDIFPEIDIPVINVIWTYKGMDAEEVERRITTFSEYAYSSNVNDIRKVESQTLNLTRLDGSRATFEVLMTRTPVGEYRFRLTEPPTENGSAPTAEGRVVPRPGEMDRLEMNRPAMERASAASGGRFHTIADFGNLAAELPEGERVPLDEPREPWPVWNHLPVFLLVLGMFAGEWALRKRQNLA